MSDEIARRDPPGLMRPSQYREILKLRRMGWSPDRIAEHLGYEDGFEVVDILNALYKMVRPLSVDERRDSIEAQIDDLITAYKDTAENGDLRAAKFLLNALELKLKMHGAIAPSQINVSIDNRKPWEHVLGAVLVDSDDNGKVVEAEVVNDDEVNS